MTQKDKQKIQISIDHANTDDQLWFPNDTDAELLLDVFQDDNNIYVKSTIAGADADKLDISINNDMLTIRGRREDDEEINFDDYFYKECYWGSFSRSIILPVEVKTDEIKAEMHRGVLKITLPKVKRTRNIPINIKD